MWREVEILSSVYKWSTLHSPGKQRILRQLSLPSNGNRFLVFQGKLTNDWHYSGLSCNNLRHISSQNVFLRVSSIRRRWDREWTQMYSNSDFPPSYEWSKPHQPTTESHRTQGGRIKIKNKHQNDTLFLKNFLKMKNFPLSSGTHSTVDWICNHVAPQNGWLGLFFSAMAVN